MKGFGICLVALACDLRRKKLVNVWEHERQKCSTGIVSTLTAVAEGAADALDYQVGILLFAETSSSHQKKHQNVSFLGHEAKSSTSRTYNYCLSIAVRYQICRITPELCVYI